MPAIGMPLAFLIGSGAAAGASIYGAHKQGGIAKQQQQMAQQNFERSRPAYDASQQYYMSMMQGGPQQTAQALGPEINNINRFYQNAQKNVMNNAMTRGGGLASRMTGLEGDRAYNLSNLVGTVRPQAAAALANLANGQQVNALHALAGASQSQYNASAQNAEAWGNIGGFITRMLSNPSFMSKNNTNGPGGPTGAFIPPAVASNIPGLNLNSAGMQLGNAGNGPGVGWSDWRGGY